MKPAPQVAVIVVSYNTRELLRACLESILESIGSVPVEVVVVDNASSDGSADTIQSYPQVTLIKNEVNRGFGVACNQAIRTTTAPLILLLNSDARLTAQAFVALCDSITGNSRCGAAGCATLNAEGIETTNTWNFLTPLNQAMELSGIVDSVNSKKLKRSYKPQLDHNQLDCDVDWIDGACLMLRRVALDEVGLFDEAFFMYSEDEDLCIRLKRHGWSICYTVRGSSFHQGAASTEKNKAEMLRQFYYSQRLFLSKHGGKVSTLIYLISMKAVLILKELLSPSGRTKAREHRIALSKASPANAVDG